MDNNEQPAITEPEQIQENATPEPTASDIAKELADYADSMSELANDQQMDSIRQVEQCLNRVGEEELGRQLMDDYNNLRKHLDIAFERLRVRNNDEIRTGVMEFLSNGNLDIHWLIKNYNSIHENLEDKQVEVKFNEVSNDGFVSRVLRAQISRSERSSISAVIKLPETRSIRRALETTIGKEAADEFLPPGGEEDRIQAMRNQFNREVEFYNKARIPGIRIPCCYYTQPWSSTESGVVMMEDLCHFKTVSFFRTMNIPQFHSVAEELLHLHKFSHERNTYWGQLTYPAGCMALLKNMTKVVDHFVSKHPMLARLYPRIRHLYEKPEFFEYCLLKAHKELGLPDVICHGDLWTYNLMWHGFWQNQVGAIIDWQNVHLGSIAEDFGHLLVFSCDPEVRHEVEKNYLPKYFERLALEIKKTPGKLRHIKKETFMLSYRISFTVHALHLAFIAHVMLCYKKPKDDQELKRWTDTIVSRVYVAWQDTLRIIRHDLPRFLYTNEKA